MSRTAQRCRERARDGRSYRSRAVLPLQARVGALRRCNTELCESYTRCSGCVVGDGSGRRTEGMSYLTARLSASSACCARVKDSGLEGISCSILLRAREWMVGKSSCCLDDALKRAAMRTKSASSRGLHGMKDTTQEDRVRTHASW